MAEPADLVIVSTEATTEGRAVYPVDVLTLKKDLEANGLHVEFQHPADQRAYKRLYSDAAELVVSFAIGLGSSGAIEALQCLAGLGGDRQVNITATSIDEQFEYEGPASDAERTIRAWHDDQRTDGTPD